VSLAAGERNRARFRGFVEERITPHADEFDRDQAVPDALLEEIAKQGYLGAVVPPQHGGTGLDMVSLGILHEEVGRGSASVQSLLTVHGMASLALLRFGTEGQRQRWLPRLASGETIAGFALTEPEAGSDAQSARTRATPTGDGYVLNGSKAWISSGRRADAFLVYAQGPEGPQTFWVESATPGVSITPTRDMLGFRAAMLAEIEFSDCRVPEESRIGPPGGGFSFVVGACLDLGRYCVACGAVGLGQACLEACMHHTSERRQFGRPLGEQPLVQRLVTRMIANVEAARLLCRRAGELRGGRHPRATLETLIAKYFAAGMARECATDAVQLHGAAGCSGASPVQRYFRDAKILEIIEGSSQLLETLIASQGSRSLGT